MGNLKKALKKAKPGGDAVPVWDESGKVIGYCGILGTVDIGTPKIKLDLGVGLRKCLEARKRYNKK